MKYLRSAAFDVFAVLWTLLLSPSLLVLWALRKPSRQIRAVSLIWVKGLMAGLRYIVGLDFVERGRGNIPNEPCLVIANHQSTWETLALSALFPGAAFIAKRETGRIPIVGWYLKNYPMIMIDRKAGQSVIPQMIEDARATLDDGRSVIIFPEGTRKRISDPVAFRRGIEFLYADLERPVLPVALNSGLFWPSKTMWKRGGTITVSHLPAIRPGLLREEFKERAEAALQAEKEWLRMEGAAPRSPRAKSSPVVRT